MTQFVRYLHHRGTIEQRNMYKIEPGQQKSDSTYVNKNEAEVFNSKVPDFFSEEYYSQVRSK